MLEWAYPPLKHYNKIKISVTGIPIFGAISEFPLCPGNSQYMISGNKTREFSKTCNTTTRLQLVSLGITVFQNSKLACLPAIGVFSNSSLEKLRRINQNHGIDVKRTIFDAVHAAGSLSDINSACNTCIECLREHHGIRIDIQKM